MEFFLLLFFIIMAIVTKTIGSAGKAAAKGNRQARPYDGSPSSAAARPQRAAQQPKTHSSKQPARSTGATGVGSTTHAVREKAKANAQTTIVERAKANNARLEADETLASIESAHGHRETEEAAPEAHSRNCRTLEHDPNAVLVDENLLGTTEDLIVKGFSGNMTFRRDFLAESMDMLSAISFPDTALKAQDRDEAQQE